MKFFKIDMNNKTHKKLTIAASIVFAIAIIGIIFHIIAAITLRYHTDQDAVLTVATIKAVSSPATEEIILPGTVQAWHEAIIYARINGYIKEWKTDIGDRVKAGDLLAEIEAPEVDAQLRQTEADLKTAEANDALAQTTAVRWQKLLKTDSVSKQEADEKTADALSKDAIVNSMLANRDRLRELVKFEKVTAPFDGIITLRNTDIGSLITQGSTTELPLFRISEVSPLRIYVSIPQNYASRVTPTMIAELHFSDHPGKIYYAKLFQTAGAIDPSTRTLLAQFVMDNPNYEILPGSYTTVHLKFPSYAGSIRLPINTILFRAEGLQIAVLDVNNKVVLKSIIIGRDFGNQVQIDSGIKPGDIVIVNPSDSLVNGQRVKVVSTQ